MRIDKSLYEVIVQQPKECLGWCTITSKTKINIFFNFFFTLSFLREPSSLNFFQKTLILAFEAKSAYCPYQNWLFFSILAHCVWCNVLFRFKIISLNQILNYFRTSQLFTFATRFLHALIRAYALHRLADSIESKKAKNKPLLPSVFSFSNLATNSMVMKVWISFSIFDIKCMYVYFEKKNIYVISFLSA